MKYIQPYDQPSNATAPYVDINAALGIDGSKPPAKFFNNTQAEIVNVITGAGLTPSDTQLNQLYLAILALIPPPSGGPSDASLVHWGIDSSTTGNSIVLTPSPTVVTVARGFTINFIPLNTSTGPTTVTINLVSGSVTYNLLRSDLTALAANSDIIALRRASIVFDGVQFYIPGGLYIPRLVLLTGQGLWIPDAQARVAWCFGTGPGGGGGSAAGAGSGQGGGAGGTDINLIPLAGLTGILYSVGVGGIGGVGNGNDGSPGSGPTTLGNYIRATQGQGGFGDNGGSTYGLAGKGMLGIWKFAGNPGQSATGGQQSGLGGAAFWGGAGPAGVSAFRQLGAADAGPGESGSGGGGGQLGGPTGNGARGGDGFLGILQM